MGLNYIILSGEVLNVPEKKHTPEGQPVVSFNLAVRTGSPEGNVKSSTLKVSVGKKLVNYAMTEVKQSDEVIVEGKLYSRSIENRLGQKQKMPYILAFNIQVLKHHQEFQLMQHEIDDPDEEIPF